MTMFSKLLFGLALLFMQIGFAPALLASPAPPENCTERPYDKGRLWKVTKGDAVPSYIFGTMHSKDPRILHLPGIIMQVFMASNTAVFETSLKDDELARNQQMMLLEPGQSLKEKLGEPRFNELSRIAAKYGMAPVTLDRVKVWAAAAIISCLLLAAMGVHPYIGVQGAGQAGLCLGHGRQLGRHQVKARARFGQLLKYEFSVCSVCAAAAQ